MSKNEQKKETVKNKEEVVASIKKLLEQNGNIDELVDTINTLRKTIHEYSPFKTEPVDYVQWVKNSIVVANDYNPNTVAPPEMKLLELSIHEDGYTQPIVGWNNGDKIEVVDGFHRTRVGKESKVINSRVYGFLPVVVANQWRTDKSDRMASTIRHNRARGKHQVSAMSEIILELKNRNWKNERIAKELGMDEEEILRLCQITGLESLFKDTDFSKSWESDDSVVDYEVLTDEVEEDVRTVNTDDPERIFHTYEKWECYKAGFYASKKEGMTSEQCEQMYFTVLSNERLFKKILAKVTKEWKNSCEHYLTNKAMNRLAWLGQAAVCYYSGVPSAFSVGWGLLNKEQQDKANQIALVALNNWLEKNSRTAVSLEQAISQGRQVSIY